MAKKINRINIIFNNFECSGDCASIEHSSFRDKAVIRASLTNCKVKRLSGSTKNPFAKPRKRKSTPAVMPTAKILQDEHDSYANARPASIFADKVGAYFMERVLGGNYGKENAVKFFLKLNPPNKKLPAIESDLSLFVDDIERLSDDSLGHDGEPVAMPVERHRGAFSWLSPFVALGECFRPGRWTRPSRPFSTQ